ncbi:glycosyltransferase [Parvicella tangerina]|uniref:glycosyltransferase n=1 Tax=Parvicella tangerina TaxID=2829795 RepID=UPI00215C8F9E|nr:glycosyltransferase [Parvicella tangerina]
MIVLIIPGIGFIGLLGKGKTESGNIKISVVIPFRDEANSANKLCRSINQLDYPRDWFEVILVDDASTDDTLALLGDLDKSIDHTVIQLAEQSGKKAALSQAIAEAKYDYILTVDADCELPKDLLRQVQPQADVSLGVALKTTNSWRIIENIQEAESLLLAGITLGSANMEVPMLATGANLAYRKSVFQETIPYHGNMHIPSGDDMFLLKAALDHEVVIHPRIGKPVTTHCEVSWNAYLEQSARWSGKNKAVGLPQASLAAWLVLIANLLLPLSLITHFSSGWIILFIKFVVDFLFLFLGATYYERFKVLLFAPLVFWFYPIHLLRVVIKILQNTGKRNND